MRVNAPRFGVITFYCRHADVPFAVVCHCREPPITEAEPRSLFDFVSCHIMVFSSWFSMGILPVILPLSLRENGREKRPFSVNPDCNRNAAKLLGPASMT